MTLAAIIHDMPYSSMVFAVVGIVLLVFPSKWLARATDGPAPERDPTYRRRVAVFRSAGISLLILALITYFVN